VRKHSRGKSQFRNRLFLSFFTIFVEEGLGEVEEFMIFRVLLEVSRIIETRCSAFGRGESIRRKGMVTTIFCALASLVGTSSRKHQISIKILNNKAIDSVWSYASEGTRQRLPLRVRS